MQEMERRAKATMRPTQELPLLIPPGSSWSGQLQ